MNLFRWCRKADDGAAAVGVGASALTVNQVTQEL